MTKTYTFKPTISQLALIHTENLLDNYSAYNIARAFKVKGKLEIAILTKAIEIVINNHESLRTHFVLDKHEIKGVISTNLAYSPTIQLLTSFNPGDIDTYLSELVKRKFDLEKSPLLEITIISSDQDTFYLLFVFSHIIFDGWSTNIFFNELSKLYKKLTAIQPTNMIAQSSNNFSSFAEWQSDYLLSDQASRELSFWHNYLATVEDNFFIPTGKSRPLIYSFKGDMEKFLISQEISRKIKSLSRDNSTVFITLLSIFQIMLHKILKLNKIITGFPLSGRGISEWDSTIGFFTNTVAMYSNITPNQTLKEITKKTKDQLLDIYENQNIPFTKIVDQLNIKKTAARTPLFQYFFVHQNIVEEQFILNNLTVENIELTQYKTSHFDLTFNTQENKNGEFELIVEYYTELYDKNLVSDMANYFIFLVDKLTSEPDKPISQLNIEDFSYQFIKENKFLENLQRSINTQPIEILFKEDIREIWAEALRLNTVDDEQDFFELGGDSLTATSLIMKIRKKVAYKVPYKLLIQIPQFGAFVYELQRMLVEEGIQKEKNVS